ncbi:uncharacterized protein JN550_008306 [Neoarthrinium moseri]|uniref:uncharacterized protein n=1 Tax=Neoarthrinium moseri TaxID=1658444 RepID=UPI001FDB03F5|nr:uncharacterized protein JN550_008306 [Neoarthrinium moseri]KAI1865549.1 hypothetical protein JN550_008306 [Neoarthrinium moseri]
MTVQDLDQTMQSSVDSPIGAMHDWYPMKPDDYNSIQRENLERSRLKIPLMQTGECLHAVGSFKQSMFPQSIGLSATFDTDLVYRVGRAIGTEARSIGIHACFSPVLDLGLDPRWGRLQEAWGEDKILTSHMGVAYSSGLSKNGSLSEPDAVAPIMKHFAAHGSPQSGHNAAPFMGHGNRQIIQDLLLPFKAAIELGSVRGVMMAYNELDDIPASVHPMLYQALNDWGYDGFVMADDTGMIQLETMHHVADSPLDALKQWFNAGGMLQFYDYPLGQYINMTKELINKDLVKLATIQSHVRKILGVKWDLGLFEDPYLSADLDPVVVAEKNRDLTLEAAQKSIVLLENRDFTLPLRPNEQNLSRIALIGPFSDTLNYGDYSGSWGQYPAGAAKTIREGLLGYIDNGENTMDLVTSWGADSWEYNSQYAIPGYLLSADGVRGGLRATYFADTNFAQPLAQRMETPSLDWGLYPPNGLPSTNFSVIWEGELHSPVDITVEGWLGVAVGANTTVKLFIDDELVVSQGVDHLLHTGSILSNIMSYSYVEANGTNAPPGSAPFDFRKDATHRIRIEYQAFNLYKKTANVVSLNHQVILFWNLVSRKGDAVDQAVQLARTSDLIVLAVGAAWNSDGESGDRATLGLPPSQDALARQIFELNKPVVLVLQGGRPFAIDELYNRSAAVLSTFFPGQSGGQAIADVLFGRATPGGRMPITVPRHVGQLPVYYNYKALARKIRFLDIESSPAYPFGYGLSYTTFAADGLAISQGTFSAGDVIKFSVKIKNTGSIGGSYVAQVYLLGRTSSIVQPVKQLVSFKRVHLAAQEELTVQLDLDVDRYLTILNRWNDYNTKVSYLKVLELVVGVGIPRSLADTEVIGDGLFLTRLTRRPATPTPGGLPIKYSALKRIPINDTSMEGSTERIDPRLLPSGEPSVTVSTGPSHNGVSAQPTDSPSTAGPTPASTAGPVPYGAAPTPQTPTQPHDGDASFADASGTTPHDPNDPNDPKRPRACEACRGLKVRCEPDPNNPDGPCKRCAKAGRNCLVTQPTRKRQKKTDSRVAELEKKIDALTASLHASRGGPAPSHPSPAEQNAYNHVQQQLAHAARDWNRTPTRDPPAQYAPEPDKQHVFVPPMVMAGQKRKATETRESSSEDTKSHPPPAQANRSQEYATDMIDRGLMTIQQANEFFARYTDHMAGHLPAVVFPPGTTASEIRKTKPILFLAVMAAASSEVPNIQRQLVKELVQLFADKIVVAGEKSLELVQALQVGVIWYHPPEHFEELKFYQFVHMGAVMAIDIGLGRKRNSAKQRMIPYTWKDHPLRKNPLPDPTTLEARRAWLSSYFLASNVAMALHRPNLVRWTSFMTECMDILESSPEAAETDKYLCHLVWTHRLAEEVGIQFSMDDPNTYVSVAEPKVQYALKGFERDLEKYSESIPKSEKKPSLQLSFHVLSLYMHEIALYVEKADDLRPPYNADALRDPVPGLNESLTTAHIVALSSCLTAIDGIFETFLSMDVYSIRCLPVFNFVRVAYAVVVLIKMYFSASTPGSELGRVIVKDDMKVEEYLDRLLAKFSEVGAADKSRPATKFLVVLVMIRGWFQKQGKPPGPEIPSIAQKSSPNSDSAAPKAEAKAPAAAQRQPPQQANEYNPANTPLQLLSEIATGNRGSQNPTANNSNAQFPDWLQTSQPFMYGASAGTSTSGIGNDAMSSFMPYLNNSFNADFDYSNLGDGFEQAMGLTFGGFTGPEWGAADTETMRFVMDGVPYMNGQFPYQ